MAGIVVVVMVVAIAVLGRFKSAQRNAGAGQFFPRGYIYQFRHLVPQFRRWPELQASPSKWLPI